MIAKYNPNSEFSTPERCHTNELFNLPEDKDCSIARARVEPGTTTQLHALEEVVERYLIIQGEGMVELDGKAPETVRPLDTVLIPAGISQRITNTGNSDLVFLCICTPRFSAECYHNLE